MLRKIGILLALSTVFGPVFGQIFQPVSWEWTSSHLGGEEYELIFKAEIDDTWSVYSQYLDSEDGPIPTSFNFDESDHFSLIGKTEESGKRLEGFDPIFEMKLVKYKNKVTFTQKIKCQDTSVPITGYLTFMTCNDERCLPPEDVDFSFNLKPSTNSQHSTESKPVKGAPTAEESAPKLSEPAKEKEEVKDGKKSTSVAPAAQSKPSNTGILDPVKWGAEIKKINDNTFELVVKAKIQEGWNIYSQSLSGEDGPIPTTFYFDEGDHYALNGETKESSSKLVKEYDKNFDMELIKLKKDATYKTTLNVKDPTAAITGAVEFMCCDDSRCLPPTEVVFEATPAKLQVAMGDDIQDTGLADPAVNIGSENTIFSLNLEPNASPVTECAVASTSTKNKGIWSIFFLGLLGGLFALLTPCVFPMIPLTVSFFTKGSENKSRGMTQAVLYGVFILGVYLLLSIPFHLMDSINPDILNEISTNVWLNIAFFLIFLFFAFSFFGYYELTLPSSWANKTSQAEGIGGVLGVFFMALTLALVSFSCTGPILGGLLAGAISSNGGAMQLTAGMGGFGLALALPFALFAAFPSWMNNLPKSGGWLNSVKVVLGFAELALAFKFLSNADLVKRWGLLKIEPFLIIWIMCAIGLALYLFGKIKFPHDSPIKKLSKTRMSLGVLAVAFAIYLASGFIYNEKTNTFTSLTLLSGLAPPVGYSWIYPKKCPGNLDCFKDLEQGISYAKEKNKPVILDFTGYACVNCRKMEEHIWPKSPVNSMLKEDFVLISLYVDDKVELPTEEQKVVETATGGTRKLRTYGNKWAHFQTQYFNINSQPYYVLLSPDGKLLNQPVAYTPDADKYAEFLRCGLDAFEQLKDGELLGSK